MATIEIRNASFSYGTGEVMMAHGRFIAVGSAEEVMTEEQLSSTYGVRVRIYGANDGETTVRYCAPVLEQPCCG